MRTSGSRPTQCQYLQSAQSGGQDYQGWSRMAPDDIPVSVLREILLDPVTGVSARLLVSESLQTQQTAKLDAILLELSGDAQTKGLIEIVRDLQQQSANRMDSKRYLRQDVLWRGLGIALITIVSSIIVRHYVGW